MIKINALSKKFEGREEWAIHELNLEIPSPSIYGIIGPNGAGKTTLINMLCGLLKPSSGDFTIQGKSFRSNPQYLRGQIGVVPQEYALYPSLTAYENLHYFGAMYGLKNSQLKNRIEELLEKVGLSAYAHTKIEAFSGGMKRRINLLAGILHQPQVVFLDEPTVGVDLHSKNVLIDFLNQYYTEGHTLIYTSHHLQEAQNLCTQMAIIDHGKILAQGSPQGLIEQVPQAHNLEDVFIYWVGKELRDYA